MKSLISFDVTHRLAQTATDAALQFTTALKPPSRLSRLDRERWAQLTRRCRPELLSKYPSAMGAGFIRLTALRGPCVHRAMCHHTYWRRAASLTGDWTGWSAN
ncbi:MAG: hypothetical protein ACXIT4_12730 [Erythrobacter sp.]